MDVNSFSSPDPHPPAEKTLGDVLYARQTARVPENYWRVLVHSIAAGDQAALHSLYAQTHRIVYTLIVRITGDRKTAEALTVDVYGDVWRQAGSYDAGEGSVLGWILNPARRRALDRRRTPRRKQPTKPERSALMGALSGLTPEERQAIETAFSSEHGPVGAHRTQIRSGLIKLRAALSRTGGRRGHSADHSEAVCLFALNALPDREAADVGKQISVCADCRHELRSLSPILDALVHWPTPLLRPSAPLWDRVVRRIARNARRKLLAEPFRVVPHEWEEAAPGIFCRLLATDADRARVTLLVRLEPGTDYPPHVHAGVEELYMLEGELLVNDRKLFAGDYLRSEPGTADRRVWSEGGCMGVLITSVRDKLA